MKSVFSEKGHCCGCSACYHICPLKAIQMKMDEEGFLYPWIDQSKCVNCCRCQAVCPFIKESHCKNQGEPDFYVARHRSEETLFHSASGGAFTGLSDVILREGGVVYGADFDQSFHIHHVRAENEEQRNRMRVSKYVQSSLGDVFCQVKKDLAAGRSVLFSGTPCQNAGLKSYLMASTSAKYSAGTMGSIPPGGSQAGSGQADSGQADSGQVGSRSVDGRLAENKQPDRDMNPRQKGQPDSDSDGLAVTAPASVSDARRGEALPKGLYLCDIICHSVPSPLIWEDFKALLEKDYGGSLEKVEFRTKKLPWGRENSKKTFTVKVAGDEREHVDNRFYRLFFGEMAIMRPSCEACPFADIRRVGDVTIADYWGIEKYAPQWNDSLGVSLILTSTEKGKSLLSRCQDSMVFEKRSCEEEIAEQPRLTSPVTYPESRALFWEKYRKNGLEFLLNELK